jgi:hypothetical protein
MTSVLFGTWRGSPLSVQTIHRARINSCICAGRRSIASWSRVPTTGYQQYITGSLHEQFYTSSRWLGVISIGKPPGRASQQIWTRWDCASIKTHFYAYVDSKYWMKGTLNVQPWGVFCEECSCTVPLCTTQGSYSSKPPSKQRLPTPLMADSGSRSLSALFYELQQLYNTIEGAANSASPETQQQIHQALRLCKQLDSGTSHVRFHVRLLQHMCLQEWIVHTYSRKTRNLRTWVQGIWSKQSTFHAKCAQTFLQVLVSASLPRWTEPVSCGSRSSNRFIKGD